MLQLIARPESNGMSKLRWLLTAATVVASTARSAGAARARAIAAPGYTADRLVL